MLKHLKQLILCWIGMGHGQPRMLTPRFRSLWVVPIEPEFDAMSTITSKSYSFFHLEPWMTMTMVNADPCWGRDIVKGSIMLSYIMFNPPQLLYFCQSFEDKVL